MTSDAVLKIIERAAAEGWQRLNFLDWGLTELPEEIYKLKNLTELNIRSNAIGEIPEAIAKLKNLTVIDLTSNRISKIPETITELKNLTKLYLSDNQINEIPEAIAKLKNLTKLHLSFNNIKEIPYIISELKKLTFLDLGDNKIGDIPDVVSELKNLTSLNLSLNQIKDIPDVLSELKKLTFLDLSVNQISKIPEVITELKNLSELKLNFNKIGEIPECIIQMKSLEKLDLTDNPIQNYPMKIVKNGIYAIRHHILLQELSHYQNNNSFQIERSIEFPPEYWTAGNSILSYFSHILNVKYPNQNIKVKIEQEGLVLRMIIDTPEGQRELIEQTLNEYGMVIAGKLSPESFLNNPFEIMALKYKLEMTQLELKMSKELFAMTSNRDRADIVDLKTQVRELQSIIGAGLQPKDNKSNLPITVNVTVIGNDKVGNDKVGNDKVGQDKIGHDKIAGE